jgi:MoxR-like ATPase
MSRRPELARLQRSIERVIKGKSEVIRKALIAMLARGHLLIEDVPGVGKTTLAHLLATSISCTFQRIQFTSDLLPSDILGVTIYRQSSGEFEFQQGPIFANIVLADEINRTTPKTQSALLEAMNNAQVSIDKKTYQLPRPFMVIATQNPVEFHGTFPLPKSQMDRFLMRLHMGYPDLADEVTVLREQRVVGQIDEAAPVVTGEEVGAMQDEVANVAVEEDLLDYIARIVNATRHSPLIELGVSPRGALALRMCAQARAHMEGRDYCVPDDVKEMVMPVLAHRIQVAKTFETSGLKHHEDEAVLMQVVDSVEVPI